MQILSVEPTPNPNARKFVCGGVLCAERASFRSPAEATGHPIGEQLMAVPGIASVMLLGNFVTVVRQPDAPWPPIIARVRQLLSSL